MSKSTISTCHHRLCRQASHLFGAGRMKKPPKPPAVLDAIADVVLRYKPKPASTAAKKRKKKARKEKSL